MSDGSAKHPQDLASWVSFLADKPLPILAHSRQFLLQHLRDPDVALLDLAPALQADPSLSLHLLRQANQINANQETDIRTLDHALSSLGLQRIRELLGKMPVLQINDHNVAHRQYLYALTNAQHAAVQARDWAQQWRPNQAAQIYAASLLYSFVYWALWRYAPERISAVYERVYVGKEDVVLAETEELGCPAQSIGHALAQTWQLPELLVQALDHATSPDRRQLALLHRRAQGKLLEDKEERKLNHLTTASWMPVKLANWLAYTLHFGWHSRKTERIKNLIADFLRRPLEHTSARIHRLAALAARQYPVPGILVPAARLVLIEEDQPLPYRLPNQDYSQQSGQATASPTTARSLRPNHLKDVALVQDLAKHLSQHPKQFNSPQALLETLLVALHEGVGLERVVAFIPQKGVIAGRLSAGDGVEVFRQLNLSLEVPSLFKRLCSSSSALHAKPDNHAKLLPLLPDSLRRECAGQDFMLMSMVLGNKPLAIIYADAGHNPAQPTELHYRAFRQLVQCALRGLTQLYQARQQGRS
ncbi:HDOD domain-containing protein [Balneatrix alpica]|uniref:HDOD domain-containing protein n=1 Tax=Balneatrix alpica TaxID=75684 RepID=UPI0027397332|nr:HDOD domain-containing protein [Balneatrix alpica]